MTNNTNLYESPEIEVVNICAEDCFAASPVTGGGNEIDPVYEDLYGEF